MDLFGFDEERFKDGLLVVQCITEEDAKSFLKYLSNEYGYKWNGGDDLQSENNWEHYKGNTCYYGGANQYNRRVQYSNRDFYENTWRLQVLVYGEDFLPYTITIDNDEFLKLINPEGAW